MGSHISQGRPKQRGGCLGRCEAAERFSEAFGRPRRSRRQRRALMRYPRILEPLLGLTGPAPYFTIPAAMEPAEAHHTRRRLRRPVIRVAALTLGSVVVVMLGLAAIQRRILFPRHLAMPYANAGKGVAGLETLWIDTPEGKVEGWWLPAFGSGGRRPAVVFAHGNAELIDYWPEMLQPYRKMGVGVLLPEYRGYGRSAGSPSQDKISEDFEKFYDWLAARPEVDAGRIIFHGRSLGGGAVCALARRRKPAAMILQSTFTSVAAVAARFLLPGFMIADPFDNLSVIKEYAGPLLVVHGRQDELIPFGHGVRLAEAAKQGRLLATEGDHNSTPPNWQEFFIEVEKFLHENGILEEK